MSRVCLEAETLEATAAAKANNDKTRIVCKGKSRGGGGSGERIEKKKECRIGLR